MVSEDFIAFKEITKDIPKMNKKALIRRASVSYESEHTQSKGEIQMFILHRAFKIQKYQFTAKWKTFT